MFRVKICGITTPEDARLAAAAGADAIGLNFYSKSPRSVSVDQAQAIASALPPGVVKVGVFVNASVEMMREAVRRVPLDLIQLHGDEPAEALRELRPVPTLRAIRMAEDLAAVPDYLQRCHRLSCLPRMLLIDAQCSTQYGGSGKTVDWGVVRRQRPSLQGLPLVLAGGLKPGNVSVAIEEARPWAVDTASGVELSPGKKCPQLVREFVSLAKLALAQAARAR